MEENIKSRKIAASLLNKGLKNISWITTPKESQEGLHTYNQFSILVPAGKRNNLMEFLKENGIPSMIYYPIPLHEQSAFSANKDRSSLIISEELKTKILSLPINPEISPETIDFIVDKLKNYK